MSIMLSVMTGIANGNEPFDGFSSDISFCISFVMNLSSTSPAIYATPVISLEY
jgi:hypothetical protein